MTNTQTVDLTPTPRILHILGDIPFQMWQCFAELIDNAIDAFSSAKTKAEPITSPTICISWSNSHVPEFEREITISDNGPGMDIDSLRNAAKAGYSSNDPIHNLGLFGMGFNIATARMGDESWFWSTRKGDATWIGIKIDFDELVRTQSFAAPVVTREKNDPEQSGTEIVIKRLRGGTYHDIMTKRQQIRKQLERIYAPILSSGEVKIMLDNIALQPRQLCVWDASRFVVRKGSPIYAVQKIDEELAESYFDVQKNRYITEDEYYDLSEEDKKFIHKRKQHLTGWIGVQRYGDVSDYGFDFIRNGRKILLSDKRLFEFVNPETGTKDVEYPVDLGSTYGGRIVGEFNVDYLIPTYQKNEFLPSGNAWQLTCDAIRGAGPIQKKIRVKLGYDGDNPSLLAKMCSAYRRPEAGIENLCVLNETAKQMAEKFYAHDPDYQSDKKWFALAQAANKGGVATQPTSSNNSGVLLPAGNQQPTASVSGILGGAAQTSDATSLPGTCSTEAPNPTTPNSETKNPLQEPIGGVPNSGIVNKPVTQLKNKPAQNGSSEKDDLLPLSELDQELSGDYKYQAKAGPLQIKAYRITSGDIRTFGQRVPCVAFKDGVEVAYFYDISHPLLANYPLTPKQLLLVYLAQSFCDRDPGLTILPTFLGLMENCLGDESINPELLREKAKMFIDTIKEKLPVLFVGNLPQIKEVIEEDSIDNSLFLQALVKDAGDLYQVYQGNLPGGEDALAYIPDSTLVRIISKFPILFFDSKVFKQPYESIDIPGNEQLTKDLRRSSVSVVTSYLQDMAALISGVHRSLSKQELLRFSNSITLLSRMIVE